jgi:MFS family permease
LRADAARTVSRRTSHALDLLNFFLADVRDGLGPYLSIYLLLTHHWDQASIGFVMGVGGIAAIIAQTPVGAFVDRTTAKRALVVAGAVTVTAGALAMPLFPRFFAISILQALTGVAGSVFAPALAAITLGIFGAGIFGALFPLVVQDLTHGTGRFNVSLGAVTTAWGVGAALSNIVAGWIVVVASYDVAFGSLGALAGVGFALYLTAMPETGPNAAIRAKKLPAEPPPNGGGVGERSG